MIYIALNASLSIKMVPKSLAAGAPPQTPLRELAALPQTPSCDELGSKFDDTAGFSSQLMLGKDLKTGSKNVINMKDGKESIWKEIGIFVLVYIQMLDL